MKVSYLQTNWDLGRRLDVRGVLSSTMVYACDGERDVQNKHDLLFVNDVQRFSTVQRELPRQWPRNHHPSQMPSVCTDDSTSASRQRSSSRPERACKQPGLRAHGLQVRWPFCRFCCSHTLRLRTLAADLHEHDHAQQYSNGGD